jgi:hypothetical protein
MTIQLDRWIWDIECYANLFHIGAKNVRTGERRRYSIHPECDNRNELIAWVRDDVADMVGFNSLEYDCPMLHYFVMKLYPLNLPGNELCLKLKEKSDKLIYENRMRPFANIVKQPLRPQIDIRKIHHLDNKAKLASLKQLEFYKRMKNIEELPFHHAAVLEMWQIEKVIVYCDNDVDATEEMYKDKITQEALELRHNLSQEYRMDMTNFNDPKIGEKIFEKILKKELGTDQLGKTPRAEIRLSDAIFPYVRFNSHPFNLMLSWLRGRVITETKGAFTEIPFSELLPLEGHYNVKVKKKCQENLNIIYKGFEFVFGTGGIHGSIKPGVYQATDTHSIVDIDVSSYYPNLSIQNDLYPEHLSSVFCTIYKGIYIKRQQFPKTHSSNKGLKLGLNGVYGKSNSAYSCVFDPLYTMKITINGQLLLCMLAERILDTIEDLTLLQINTDGLTVLINNNELGKLDEIKRLWQNYTRLELEEVKYSKMAIRDVNNYLAVKVDGKTKLKGAFEYEKELHKNHSQLIVPKAVEAYFTKQTLPEEFINNHEDLFDFFKLAKIPRNFNLVGRNYEEREMVVPTKRKGRTKKWLIQCITEQVELQHVTRYFVTYDHLGYNLVKIMPPAANRQFERHNSVEVGHKVIECNNLATITPQEMKEKLNRQYYIHQAYRLINAVEKGDEFEDETESDE